MKKDKFTNLAKGKGYMVRSLYFDTNDLSAYHEKMSGDNERVKFRIRSYSDKLTENTAIRVELKARRNNVVIKNSTFVSAEEYKYFMKHRIWKDTDDPTLIDFSRYMHQRNLEPKVITYYFREGYQMRSGDNLRITFDHDVQSTHSNTLFPDFSFYRRHGYNSVILEIKFAEDPPLWITELVQNYGLKVLANSKFTQGIQIARFDLHHPGGVVFVR